MASKRANGWRSGRRACATTSTASTAAHGIGRRAGVSSRILKQRWRALTQARNGGGGRWRVPEIELHTPGMVPLPRARVRDLVILHIESCLEPSQSLGVFGPRIYGRHPDDLSADQKQVLDDVAREIQAMLGEYRRNHAQHS